MDVDVLKLISDIEALKNEGCKNITFYVNSDGGDVAQGNALFSYLDRNDLNITWVVDGVAASMMAVLMTNPKHTVKAAKCAKFMYHRVQGYVYGNAEEVRAAADMIVTFEDSLVEMMATRMKCDVDSVRKEFFTDGIDHWMSAEQAVNRGLCDSIVSSYQLKEATDLSNARNVFNFYNNQITNLKTEQKMKDSKKFATVLNMNESDVEKEEILLAQVQGVVNERNNYKAKLEAKEAENQTLKSQIEAANQAKVKNLVDTAITNKKFGEDERETYTALANQDFSLAEKVIGKMQGVTNVKSDLEAGADSKVPASEKDWKFDDYHKSGKLENLKKNNSERYKALCIEKFGRVI